MGEKLTLASQIIWFNVIISSALSPSAVVESEQSGNGSNTSVSLPVPPGMSEVTFKRVTHENPMRPEELEQVSI